MQNGNSVEKKHAYAVLVSDLVMFIKKFCDMIVFRNPYLVKSINSAFTHVLFRSVYNDDDTSNVMVNGPELHAPFLKPSK